MRQLPVKGFIYEDSLSLIKAAFLMSLRVPYRVNISIYSLTPAFVLLSSDHGFWVIQRHQIIEINWVNVNVASFIGSGSFLIEGVVIVFLIVVWVFQRLSLLVFLKLTTAGDLVVILVVTNHWALLVGETLQILLSGQAIIILGRSFIEVRRLDIVVII